MSVTVLTTNEYDPDDYDGALIKERTVVLLDVDDERARTVPLSNVVYLDGDREDRVPGNDVAEEFYGGCEYAFLEDDQFPAAME